MIFDNLKNSKMYYGVNEDFEKAFKFIEKAATEKLPTGRYEIDGDNVYAAIQEYTTKSGEDALFEGHHKYIDIQYISSGIEAMEVIDISNASEKTPYDQQYDVKFFENKTPYQKLVLQSGDFAVFYPHDLHKPGLSFEGAPTVMNKIVVKIAVK